MYNNLESISSQFKKAKYVQPYNIQIITYLNNKILRSQEKQFKQVIITILLLTSQIKNFRIMTVT